HPGALGLRPDEDLLKDLAAEGFDKPLLFRTAAQYWIDRRSANGEAAPPPEGEQFRELVDWPELGLTRLEIEPLQAPRRGQLRVRIPFAAKSDVPPTSTWNLAGFTHECIRVAGERSLDQRSQALANRLLVVADEEGIPADVLAGPVGQAGEADWHKRFEEAL